MHSRAPVFIAISFFRESCLRREQCAIGRRIRGKKNRTLPVHLQGPRVGSVLAGGRIERSGSFLLPYSASAPSRSPSTARNAFCGMSTVADLPHAALPLLLLLEQLALPSHVAAVALGEHVLPRGDVL